MGIRLPGGHADIPQQWNLRAACGQRPQYAPPWPLLQQLAGRAWGLQPGAYDGWFLRTQCLGPLRYAWQCLGILPGLVCGGFRNRAARGSRRPAVWALSCRVAGRMLPGRSRSLPVRHPMPGGIHGEFRRVQRIANLRVCARRSSCGIVATSKGSV